MKKIIYLIISIIFVSCSDQDLSDYFADNILYKLNLSSENINVGPIDETHSVKITTNTEWSAQTSDDWIVLDSNRGNTNSDLTFTTKANPMTQERTGTIGIYCFGKHKKDITICQGKVSLGVSSESLSFTSHCAEQSLSFQTEGTWTVATTSDWIKPSQKEGFGNCSISIMVDELMSVKDRNGYIVIKDQSSQEKKIAINQKGKYLSVDINYLSFLASGKNIEIINFSTDGSIEYTCDSWITSRVNNNHISVETTENTSGLTKNGTLYVSLKDVSDFNPIAIHIHQAPVKTNAEAVDLGLSVKWASFNIGATNEDEIGGHYHYGEGPDFTYEWYDIPEDVLPTCLTGTMYDTSNAYWGGHWRNPTKKEWQELYDNCTMDLINLKVPQNIELYNKFTDSREVLVLTQAHKFTSSNGNYIIIPRAGTWYYYDGPGQMFSSGIYAWSDCGYHTNTKSDKMEIFRQEEGMSWSYGMGPNWFISVRAVWDE